MSKQFKKIFEKYEKVFNLYLVITSVEKTFITLFLNLFVDSGINCGLS